MKKAEREAKAAKDLAAKLQTESPSLLNVESPVIPAPLSDGPPEETRGGFLASDPPHEGDVSLPAPDAPVVAQPRRAYTRRGTGGKKATKAGAPVVEVYEPSKSDIDDAKFILDLILYSPAELLAEIQSPEDEMNLRIARLGCKVYVKHFSDKAKDEYQLIALVAIWLGKGFVQKLTRKRNEQRNNLGLRSEKDRKNPLDALVSKA